MEYEFDWMVESQKRRSTLSLVRSSGVTISVKSNGEFNSRSRWPHLLVNESPAYHGEKYTNQISKINLGHNQLENQKEENYLTTTENSIKFLNTDDPIIIALNEIKDTTHSHHHHHHQNTVAGEKTIKMEEFVDLSRYCRPAELDIQCSKDVDELNTPVFELKNPFDFGGQTNRNNNTDILQQHIDHNYIINIKSEFDTVNNDILFNQCNVNLLKHIKVEDSIDILKDSLVINSNNNIKNKETVMWTQENYDFDSMNPNTITCTILDDDDDKLVTVNSFDDILKLKNSEINNKDQLYDSKDLIYDTPDESTSSSSISSKSSSSPSTNLKLNIKAAQNYIEEVPSIRTSDVIDTITEIESSKDFNILQYINEDELQLAAETSDTFTTITTNQTIQDDDDIITLTNSKSKKRKKYEDSDEEYVPPSEKRTKRQRSTVEYNMENDELPLIKSKRGRPPKRNVSISSDDYGDSPESRYRELRDKNNEASRKSRLKRKLKERELEEEGDELEEKNAKLRARVEELEKTVSRFRNNLMTLLLNKKS